MNTISDDLNAEWEFIYRKIMDTFIKSIKNLAHDWIDGSDAGKAFLPHIRWQR
jgi:hypothetical protein